MLDGKLIGSEIIDLHARLHGMDRDKRRKRIDKVLDLINMRENEGLMSEWQHRWRTS
jgi:ABC-type multidrug transport system ATPase subunit